MSRPAAPAVAEIPTLRVLVTGGAGFIGSTFTHYVLRRRRGWSLVVLDKLTYAGVSANLEDLEHESRYQFVHGDVTDSDTVNAIFSQGIDVVFNFAAETHVDRSIENAADFLRTDVFGAHTLLEAARRRPVRRFIQVSTDEVYGTIAAGAASEDSPIRPGNPYAASKAAADALAGAYWKTYGVPTIVTRACNNYGPRQHPEKLIPLLITNALEGRPLPLYGDGTHERDWLHVDDHCSALTAIAERGEVGSVYNIGSGEPRRNLDVARQILALLDLSLSRIRRVKDRPGHDRRYALDCTRLRALRWRPRIPFARGLSETISWYRGHPSWWRRLRSGRHATYFHRRYGVEFSAASPPRPEATSPVSRSRTPG